MYINLLDHLSCPRCQTDFKIKQPYDVTKEIVNNVLVCSNNHEYSIVEGVLDMGVKEQSKGNNWSKLYETFDYKTLDNMLLDKISPSQKLVGEQTLKYMIDHINKIQAKSIIDIATGRGILLKGLLESFGADKEMTCTDLSFEVLKYDRVKMNIICPEAQINYIACDVSNLPLKNESFDVAVSLAGITNMLAFTDEGINESIRVSRNGLMSTSMVVKSKENKHLKVLSEKAFEELHQLVSFDVQISKFYDFKNLGFASCLIK